MAIRNRVIWVGSPAPPAIVKALSERDLSIAEKPTAACEAELPNSCAVVINISPGQPLDHEITGLIANAFMHGLLAFVLAPLTEIDVLRRKLDSLPFGRRVKLWAARVASRIPELSARSAPGPSYSPSVKLVGCDGCSPEDMVLLRRAFSDCGEVTFTRMAEGGAGVFQAYARLSDSRAGLYPLPFFVKLDRYPKVLRELENYQVCTTHFIPFFSRPNLDPHRCLLGAERGLIIGNFVEHSDSLAEQVNRGTAQAAINSLFEDALRGWRTQAYLSVSGVQEGPLVNSVLGTFSENAHRRANTYAREAELFGATLTAVKIAKLLDDLPPIRHRRALCHGDLHGENVRVRSGQAILIDFAAVDHGPLVIDPAALETALVLRTPGKQSIEWTEFSGELYAVENLRTLPQLRSPTAPLNALWNSVRQIRRFGLAEQVSDDEYARAVAVHLLWHGLRKRGNDEDRGRRPFFVWLAERLALDLTSSASKC